MIAMKVKEASGCRNAMRQALAEEIELVEGAIQVRTVSVHRSDEWLKKLFDWHARLIEALEHETA